MAPDFSWSSSLHWHACLSDGLLLLVPLWKAPGHVHDALFCLYSLGLIYNVWMLMTTKFLSLAKIPQTNIQLPIILASQTQHILPPTTYYLHSTPTLTYLREWYRCSPRSPSPKPKRCHQCASLTLKCHFQALSKSCQCYLQVVRLHHLLTLF